MFERSNNLEFSNNPERSNIRNKIKINLLLRRRKNASSGGKIDLFIWLSIGNIRNSNTLIQGILQYSLYRNYFCYLIYFIRY